MMKRISRVTIVLHVFACIYAHASNSTGWRGHDNFADEDAENQYALVRRRGEGAGNVTENVEDNSLVPGRSYFRHLTSAICFLVPSTCATLENIFPTGASEGRGPRDLIAIVSTMLATLLGAILVKLGVLIVLSVISIAIGKLMLIVLTLKSHLFGQKMHTQPIIYEKIYYPHSSHHRDFQVHPAQSYLDEFPPYDHPQYQR